MGPTLDTVTYDTAGQNMVVSVIAAYPSLEHIGLFKEKKAI
jgi:hypothetical protein